MDRRQRWGPQTQRRLARTCGAWLVLVGIGGGLANGGLSAGWSAFGLGLVLPGGGFLAAGLGAWPLLFFVGGVALFLASLVVWFGTGAVIAPPLVWVGLAGLARALEGPVSSAMTAGLPLAVGAVAVGFLGWIGVNRTGVIRVEPMAFARVKTAEKETFETEDLARLRFILDRALQPIERFDGFQWVDQFQPAGMRYQLNFAGYALSLTQAKLPAFRGYLHEAQRRLIEKQRDWRVWRYWRLEEAWGNLRLNADPIIRDNIMYSGFVGAQIAYFQAATADRQFSEAGGFALSTPRGTVFSHDFNSMTDALMRGWNASPYGLMPCEPNWVYPMCNAIGATAVIARDSQTGGSFWPEVAGTLRRGLETELTTPAGHLVAFRSTLTGFAPPRIGGVAADATPALFYNSSFPDIAERIWGVGRQDMLTSAGSANPRHFWRIDTGDYRFSRAASCTSVAAAAAELGDTEALRASLDLLDEDCPAFTQEGVTQRRNASVFAHFVEVMARHGGRDALRSLVHGGARKPQGPVLDVRDYPATLVAAADWQDGSLRVTLVPGTTQGSRRIPVCNLRPGAKVSISGAVEQIATADDTGRLEIGLTLDGPATFTVREMP